MKTTIAILFFLTNVSFAVAQGGIDVIKKQKYLQMNIDCDCMADSCMSTIRDRHCANLSFQKSDSLLVEAYDSLLVLIKVFSKSESSGDSLANIFINLETEWRKYRKRHCMSAMIDPSCNSHSCATEYLFCLEQITMLRLLDFKRLIGYYNQKISGNKESQAHQNKN